MANTVREIIYFSIMFVLFYLGVRTISMWRKYGQANQTTATLLVGLIFTLVMVAVFYLLHLQRDKEGFDEVVSGPAMCKGGPYMWQGDSKQAQMCRHLASTPEGRCAISSYNCPTGYEGSPGLPFVYTPLSNDKWRNERCDDPKDCGCNDTGLCRMEKQCNYEYSN